MPPADHLPAEGTAPDNLPQILPIDLVQPCQHHKHYVTTLHTGRDLETKHILWQQLVYVYVCHGHRPQQKLMRQLTDTGPSRSS
jgi:hypothetical protein